MPKETMRDRDIETEAAPGSLRRAGAAPIDGKCDTDEMEMTYVEDLGAAADVPNAQGVRRRRRRSSACARAVTTW